MPVGATSQDCDTPVAANSVPTRRRSAPAARDDGPISQVLRTVYQRAVDEDIPAEMLDLLGKLD